MQTATRISAFAACVIALTLLAPPGSAATGEGDAEAWYRGCMELADSDPGRALDQAEARRKAGGGTPAGHCAAVALVRLGRFEDGAKRFEALAGETNRPDLRAGLLDQAAGAWLLKGSAEKALPLLDAAIKIAPGDAPLRLGKAQALAGLGRYQDAVGELDRAVALEPSSADAYAFRASALRRLNREDAALADLERALSLEPQHPEALLERGILRQLRGNRSGARADWETLVAVAPKSVAADAARANLDALAQRRK
ncbi:MAG: tetratricopeptide repeat protein [Rhodospirillales bacterium]|nr:tetratricopeptide repeat protein [Rhodospirillales bacterium]